MAKASAALKATGAIRTTRADVGMIWVPSTVTKKSAATTHRGPKSPTTAMSASAPKGRSFRNADSENMRIQLIGSAKRKIRVRIRARGAIREHVPADERDEDDARRHDDRGDGRKIKQGEGRQAGVAQRVRGQDVGGVEIPVNGPPRRLPRARGINSLEGGRPLRLASSIVAGRRIAATVTVLIRADSRLALTIRATISRASLPLAKRCRGWPSRWVMPVRVSPAESMNMAHTVTTAGLLKPAKASWGETSPVKAKADKTRRPTRSTRSQPPTKTSRAVAKMIPRMISCNVMACIREDYVKLAMVPASSPKL